MGRGRKPAGAYDQAPHRYEKRSMRSAQECAEMARRLIRAAARESDPALKKRILKLAQSHQALARLADKLARKSLHKT